ncbi:hypothetical protein GIB67_005938 [Kingdonia uniflora]|uniref:Uncharacterized protein n=1 Tax=Kingdonia uniflora TaxID=39325 RepID=A0A7J7MBW9_9MAGN|nr:hypothetical protein GIB67_005938 [Kingdonia uniflora]
MKHWEEWVMETSSENINVMPLLRDLYIYDCPVLKSVPHQILSHSLRKLFISDCPELTISCLPPLLEEFILGKDAGSLSRSLPFNNTSVKVMWIQNSLHSTLPQGLSQLKALQTLKVVDCNSLTCISEELQHLTSLREFYITRCPILGSRCEKYVGEDWSIMGLIGRSHKWWEKGLQTNMKEITCAQDFVDLLTNAGDRQVVVDFFSPGCGGCKALHPKIWRMNDLIYRPEEEVLLELEKFKLHILTCSSKS